MDENSWKDTNIPVGVDSGQCGIFQDSKYPNSDEERGEYGDNSKFYGKCCNLTTNENDGDVLDFGVVSSSGFGDGSYQCLYATDGNKFSALRVIFIDEIDVNLE